jgi:hypothetical protein
MIDALLEHGYEVANYIEAGLWIVMGMGFAISARRGQARRRKLLAAVTLAAFGLSDIAEVHAGGGSWWQPLWLLTWKGACFFTLIGLLIDHARRARKR